MKKHKSLNIHNHKIFQHGKCFIIAEIGQTHEGSLGLAHSLIDAAADHGADAVKFQCHIANEESTLDEKFRVKFSYEDKTRYDYWERMEFKKDEWLGLKQHATERNLAFFCSVFSIKAIEILEDIDAPAWKIGSGEINNYELLERLIKTKKPILVSTGMSGWDEINKTVTFMKNKNANFALFQCTSKYPAKFEDVGINVISEMEKRFNVPVGLSDHTGTIYPSLLAMAKGTSIIEIHITPSKYMFGPDIKSSISLNDLKILSEARDAFFEMNTVIVNKNEMQKELKSMRNLFNKSLALKKDGKKGDIITKDMITLKKPATGIPYNQLDSLLGKKLARNVSSKKLLKISDFK